MRSGWRPSICCLNGMGADDSMISRVRGVPIRTCLPEVERGNRSRAERTPRIQRPEHAARLSHGGRQAVRIDLSRATTPAEVEAAMAPLGEVLAAMRASVRRYLVRRVEPPAAAPRRSPVPGTEDDLCSTCGRRA